MTCLEKCTQVTFELDMFGEMYTVTFELDMFAEMYKVTCELDMIGEMHKVTCELDKCLQKCTKLLLNWT